MKKVLLISHYFPPRPSIGSIRPGGLAKYLPKFGWEPVVLTTTLPSQPDSKYKVIQTKYHEDFSVRIKRMLGMNPELRLDQQAKPIVIKHGKDSLLPKLMEFVYGILNYPDEMKGWMPFAIPAGAEIIKGEKIDAILSSSHPVTAHCIAAKLSHKFQIPWVADLRDLWTQNPYYQYGPIRKLFEKNLELKTFRQASALVTTSEPWANELRQMHKKENTFSITSGFDPELVNPSSLTKKFTITHTGRLYDGKRDPSVLFEAIQKLIQNKSIAPENVQLRFWGSKNHWLDQEIKKHGLENVAFQFGMTSREEALQHQRESQILLLLNWNTEKELGTYTGKIFEYLAAKRPILAIGPSEGVVSELLSKTSAGRQASNLDELMIILLDYYTQYTNSGSVTYTGNTEEVNKFSQLETAKNFASVLDRISK